MVILEVNLNGLRYGKRKLGEEFRYTYPYRSFWEIACTYDVDIVYGLDAHAPQKYADQDCYAIVNQEILYDLPLKFRHELRFEARNRGCLLYTSYEADLGAETEHTENLF